MKIAVFTRDVQEFLRVVQWCYDVGLGWVIKATYTRGLCSIHLELPMLDVRMGGFRRQIKGQPAWTIDKRAGAD